MPVDADAVDSAMGPVPSFLPPGPNIAAQALLSTPAYRALSANDLAARLHLSTADARMGIGAIVGMIQRTARGNAHSALQPEPSLGKAVGPFMSLDTAMSRYGANMGAIVSSPTPHSPAFAPDYPPDRQASAGRLPRGRRWSEAGDDLTDDTPPPIDANPGSQVSNEATDQGDDSPGSPALSTTVAPVATISPDPSVPIGPGQSPANPTGTTMTGYTMTPTGLTTPGGGLKSWELVALAAGVGLFALMKSKHKPRWLAKVKFA